MPFTQFYPNGNICHSHNSTPIEIYAIHTILPQLKYMPFTQFYPNGNICHSHNSTPIEIYAIHTILPQWKYMPFTQFYPNGNICHRHKSTPIESQTHNSMEIYPIQELGNLFLVTFSAILWLNRD